jgi:ATP-dependent RNA circularization protein (DNA/RNA ligase family)
MHSFDGHNVRCFAFGGRVMTLSRHFSKVTAKVSSICRALAKGG